MHGRLLIDKNFQASFSQGIPPVTTFSNLLTRSWFLPAIIGLLSLLSFAKWLRHDDFWELALAIGFALVLPHAWLFPRALGDSPGEPRTYARFRPFTLAAWWLGAVLLVLAIVGAWL